MSVIATTGSSVATVLRALAVLVVAVIVLTALALALVYGIAAVAFPLLDLRGLPSTGNWSNL